MTAFAALRAALYMTGFVLLWGWLALGVRPLDARLGHFPDGVRLLGAALMGLGGLLALWCVTVFVVRGRGTPAPFDPPREFVAVGPYRWMRNPMYVGGLTVLAGFALWHRSPAMLAFSGLVAGFVHLFVVGFEEPGLARRFGESYRAYLGRVNRWIPKRRRP